MSVDFLNMIFADGMPVDKISIDNMYAGYMSLNEKSINNLYLDTTSLCL
jgi:hypothetical protein